MPADEVLWDLLGTRRAERSPDEERARRAAAVRLLDAALGVLAATGQLVAVAEDVLREHRDQLDAAPTTDGPTDRPTADPTSPDPDLARPRRIDLTY